MNTTSNLSHAYLDIYERYVDEASFLWLMRSIAVNQPHYNVADVQALEVRVQAQLDGLMTSIDIAWSLCEKALELNGPGEVFAAAIVAFKSHDAAKIQKVVDAGLVSDATFKGLTSAIAWLPSKVSYPWIQKFLISKDLNHKYLAIALCSIRRENPGEYLGKFLEREDCLQHEKLYTRCLRIIGELKRHDLTPVLNKAIESKDKNTAFWASWSAILLGNKTLVQKMEPYIFTASPHQDKALNIAFRVLSINDARSWITRLSGDAQHIRSVIKATGILGDPHAVDWLILKMREHKYARLAGESFTFITGIDLEKNQLNQDAPEHYEPIPNENAGDEIVAMDDDEKLPWPNATAVASIWKQTGGQLTKGQRYLLGKEINASNLITHIQNAYQRQRHAAAMERALLNVTQVLQNTRAKVNQG